MHSWCVRTFCPELLRVSCLWQVTVKTLSVLCCSIKAEQASTCHYSKYQHAVSTTVGLAAIPHFSPRHVNSCGISQLVWTPSKRPSQDWKGGGETVNVTRRCSGLWCQRSGGRLINSTHTLWLRALVIDCPANCSCPLSICHIHLSDSAATCYTPPVERRTACTSLPIAYHNLLPGTSQETGGQNVFLRHGNIAELNIWMWYEQEASGIIMNCFSAGIVAQPRCKDRKYQLDA